jgi:hypothetical protein
MPESSIIAAEDCCDDVAQDVAVIQTAVRFASSLYGVPAAAPVRTAFVDSARLVRPDYVPGSRSSITARPQTTVLRI